MLRALLLSLFALSANVAASQTIQDIYAHEDTAILVREGDIVQLKRCDGEKLCSSVVQKGLLDEIRGAFELTDALPESQAAFAPNGSVEYAWYTRPTDRYAHGVLGDKIEGGGLKIIVDGEEYEIVLASNRVFEDIKPRLVDLDGDGSTEIITIQSSTRAGGAVVVYGFQDGKIIQVAASDFIGTPNRWLNIAAIADFRGNGLKQIIWVETPHIGGKLHIGDYDGKAFKVVDQAGFQWPRGKGLMSNHAIGSRNQDLSVTTDLDNDGTLDLVLPGADRKGIWVMRKGLEVTKIGAFPNNFEANLAFIPFDDAAGGTLVTVDQKGALMTLDIK